MKQPKIWILIPTFHPVVGGTQSQVRNLSRSLAQRGWQIEIVTRQHVPLLDGPLAPRETIDGVNVSRIFSRGGVRLGSVFFLIFGFLFLSRHGRRGIYYAQDFGAAGLLAVSARYLLRGRSLIKLRSGGERYGPRFSKGLGRQLFLMQLRLADCAVTVNDEVDALLRGLGIPGDQVVQIPNAVDSDHFCPVSESKRRGVRLELGLPVDKGIVLWTGRMEFIKGLDILIRAWASLPEKRRHEAVLLLVGEGEERPALEKLISGECLERSVLLIGFQRDIRNFYWAADYFVLPSRIEGLSNSLIEAMACGLPVIASDVGGARDILSHQENGLLFRTENAGELAERLEMLMAYPETSADLGVKARTTVINRLGLARSVDRHDRLFDRLARS